MTLTLIQVVVVIIVVGVLLWLVNNYIPMQASVKALLNKAVIIFLIVWLLLYLLRWVGLA